MNRISPNRREAMETFPQDLVVNILSRLPVKYLIQLKCVCKAWLSMISDPHFAKLQLAHNLHRFLFFTLPLGSVDCEGFSDDHNVDHVKHLEYPAVMKNIPGFGKLSEKIVGSCNGLICVVFSNGCIFLWNPTIREALELNSGDFDPRGYYIYGLGYDISTDDYKVVRVQKHLTFFDNKRYSVRLEVEILARKSDMWRKIEEPSFDIEEGAGIFLHGALHWLASRARNQEEICVVAFDMTEEKFYELVQLPDMEKEKLQRGMFLTISADSLCLFCEGGDPGSTEYLDVWRLNEYGVESSWTRIFSENKCIIPDIRFWGEALYYTKSGKIVLDYLKTSLMWYDPKGNTWEMFSVQDVRQWYQFALYVESLILPDWHRPMVA